jgi:hypothetical protein
MLQLPPAGPDNPEIQVKIIIPDEKAYELSQGGRNHMKLKHIQANYKVEIKLASPGCFFPGSGDERAALICGLSESVRIALAQFLELVEDDPSNPLVHMALPSGVVNSILLSVGGQASKYVGQTTHTQISVLPPLPNFDETVLRIARFSRTPEAPVVCVANSTVMTVRVILEADPHLQFNENLNYEQSTGHGNDQLDEYPSPPFLNPQEAARERIEFIKAQLARLASGKAGVDNTLVEREWISQASEETIELDRLRSLPPAPPQPPSLEEILSNAGSIAANLPQVLQVQCMVRIPRLNNKQASAIIGIKGANIRDIQESSGAKIKIIDSPEAVQTGGVGPSATSLKEVIITGQVNQVHGGLIGVAELMLASDEGATEATSIVSIWLRQQHASAAAAFDPERNVRSRR